MSPCDAVPVLHFKGEVAMPPLISGAAPEESPVALQRPITEINLLKRIKLIAIVAPLILAVCSTACNQNRTPQLQTASQSRNLPVMRVSVGAPVEYTTVGSVVSDQRVDVTSRLSGYIRTVLVQEGDRVQREQVLVRLDSSDVEGNIRQAQAGVSAAEAAFRDAEADKGHFQQLFEHGTVSDNELRKVALKDEAAREALNQARAALDTACAQREYVEIKSPVDGTVVVRSKRSGDLAVPGAPILTLEAVQGLLFEAFVEVGVNKESLAAFAVGKPVEVRIDGLSAPLKGTVSRFVPSADPATRSYQIKIALPERAGLTPGMFGRAAFQIGKSKLPVVPRQAMVERGGLYGVFVVDDECKATFRWLHTGREWPDRVEVTAGLRPGERLVAAPDSVLRDGDRIVVSEAHND
jgi:membrane fusion protein, multidrug efflux system